MKFNVLNKIIKNKILKETSWAFLTKGVTFVLYYIFSIYIARVMGVDLYGQWAFFFSVITIVFTLSYFGINHSTKRYVAQFSNTPEISAVLKSAVLLRFCFSLGFCVVFLFFHRLIAIWLGHPELADLFIWACPLIFFSGFVEFTKDVFIGFHRIKFNFIVNVCEFGSRLGLVFVFLFFSINLFSVLKSYLLASIISAGVGLFLVYRIYYVRQTTSVKAAYWKHIWRYSLPLFFVGIAFIFATEIGNIMLGLMQSDYEVGIYSVAKQFTDKLPHISAAIAMGTLPLFGKLDVANKAKLQAMFKKLLKLNNYLFGGICLGLALLAPILVPFLYGVQYQSSVLPLQILLIYLFCFSFSVFTCGVLDYRGRAGTRAWIALGSIVLNIILNLVFIPLWGATGAALATSLAYIPATILYYFFAKKTLA